MAQGSPNIHKHQELPSESPIPEMLRKYLHNEPQIQKAIGALFQKFVQFELLAENEQTALFAKENFQAE